MKLNNIKQLEAGLAKKFKPIYWIQSDDPCLLEQAYQLCLSAVHNSGIDDIQRHQLEADLTENWLWQTTQNRSLFSTKSCLLLRCPSTPPKALSSWLSAYLDNPSPDVHLFIFSLRLDSKKKQTKWFKKVDSHGDHLVLWPPEPHELPKWLQQSAREAGIKFTDDALKYLASCTEGNLFAAKQTIEKLATTASLGQTFDLEQTQNELGGDLSHFNVFVWSDACLAGNLARSTKILHQLQATKGEPTLLVWSLAKDLRLLLQLLPTPNPNSQAMMRLGIWQKRQPLFRQACQRLNKRQCYRALQMLARCDLAIKGLEPNSDIWLLLTDVAKAMTAHSKHHGR